MGDATVNGDLPHSATLEHIVNYPVVHDSIEAFKNNPYGQKSIDLTNAAYAKFVKQFLPLLDTPASYAKPYAVKVDEYGNLFLDKVDEKVPILKSETQEVKDTVIGYINWPVEKAGETKKYVFDIYGEEYKKCGGDGIVAGGKALITSSLVLTSEGLNWLSSFLSAKKDEAKDFGEKAKKQLKDYSEEAKKETEETASEVKEQAQEATQ